MLYKGVIFDLDGTLVYTLPSLQKSGNEMLAHYQLEPCNLHDFQEFVGEGSLQLVARLLSKRDLEGRIPIDEAFAFYLERYCVNVTFGIEVYPGMKTLCKKLKADGYKLGILTNKPHEMALIVAEEIYGQDFFDYILGQKVGAPVKPNPSLLNGVVNHLKLNPEYSYFVGDSSVDVKTAQTMDMISIGVLWGYRDETNLRDAGASYIVHDVTALESILLEEARR